MGTKISALPLGTTPTGAEVIPAVQGGQTVGLTAQQIANAHSAIPAPPIAPQGRLTLTSGTAVMASDVAAATTVYYTPSVGQFVPIYNGSAFVNTDMGGELSQATTDATKSPAAVANNSNYDIFVWNDAGTIRATRGPAWTSSTARGTGAGTTQLSMQSGLLVNTVAITNGPGAGLGTYVGTVRSDGSATINMKFGTSAAGGGKATLGVWNNYNTVQFLANVVDTNTNSTYSSATARAADNSATNRVEFVTGLARDAIAAKYCQLAQTAATAGAACYYGFGLDTTTGFNERVQVFATAAAINDSQGPCTGFIAPQIGFHFISANEAGDGSTTATFTYLGAPGNSLQTMIWM